MLKKVCLIVNYNLYESKRHFTQKLSEAMNRKGIETRIIDAQEGSLNQKVIDSIKSDQPDLTCSFNSFLPVSDTKYLWDLLEIPHLSILVDPAIYSVSLTASPYSILSCVDRADCDAVRGYNFDKVFFWPHAIESDLAEGSDDKPYDVTFLGSCYDFESLRNFWQKAIPKPLSKLLDDAIDIVFSDNQIPLANALVKAWNASNLDPQDVDFTVLFYYLDYYTRGKDRCELIRSIKDVNVHVFGDLSADHTSSVSGWSHYLKSQSNVTIHSSVPFGESFDILRKSKISLNSMPFFRNGTHERVFAGLACGALPITGESIYLRESFKDGEDLIYYQSNHWNKVNDKVNALLGDENRRKEMVQKGRQKVMQEHTWDRRVEQLIERIAPLLGKVHS